MAEREKMKTHNRPKELTGNGRARKYVAVQEFDETLDRYEHSKKVIRIWLLNVAIRVWILRSPLLCWELL